MIADAERASAIGGVMGGGDSEIGVTDDELIALESAYFQPASVRRTSKRLGLKTEASTRFERGADINAPPVGIARAAALLRQDRRRAAARPAHRSLSGAAKPCPSLLCGLPASRRLLGQDVPADQVPTILEPLGFGVAVSRNGSKESTEPGWVVTVPTSASTCCARRT